MLHKQQEKKGAKNNSGKATPIKNRLPCKRKKRKRGAKINRQRRTGQKTKSLQCSEKKGAHFARIAGNENKNSSRQAVKKGRKKSVLQLKK